MVLTTTEKLTRAVIQLYKTNPFYSYQVSHMPLIENTKIKTMAVDIRGNCYYNPEFVNKLNDEQIKTVLAHEVSHIAWLHFPRLGKRDVHVWNVATDLPINAILKENGFEFPDGEFKPLLTDYNDSFRVGDKILTDISKKTAEMIYNELWDVKDKLPRGNGGTGNGTGTGNGDGGCTIGGNNSGQGGWDTHIYEGEVKELTPTEQKELEDKWKQIITEATFFAKQKGNMPANLERMVDKLLNNKMNWKQMLYKYITNEVAHDFSYSRPSRKFISTGIYFPSVSKENIRIMAAIDTSGSISNKELALFLGQIYKITKSFNNIQLEILFHDTEISSKSKFNHSNLHKVINLKATGGGGTSHKEVFEYANKMKPNILVCFTDGCSDIDNCMKYNNTIFVLTDENVKTKFGTDVYFDRADIMG